MSGNGPHEGGKTGRPGSLQSALRPTPRSSLRLYYNPPEFLLRQLVDRVTDEYKTKQRHEAEEAKLRAQFKEDLDLIRFAFTLLRQDLGGSIDFSKINPAIILSYTRAAFLDGYVESKTPGLANPKFMEYVRAVLHNDHPLPEQPTMPNLDKYRLTNEFKAAVKTHAAKQPHQTVIKPKPQEPDIEAHTDGPDEPKPMTKRNTGIPKPNAPPRPPGYKKG